MQQLTLNTMGLFIQLFRADFNFLDPFYNKQHLWAFPHLFQTLFLSFFFFSFSFLTRALLLSFGTQNTKISFPHTCFLHKDNQKEFILSHASLCFKNKGKDSPNLG